MKLYLFYKDYKTGTNNLY